MSPKPSESIDPRVTMARERTTMASFRTALSLDRTTLAWIRTTLSMTGFGFGMVAFFRTLRKERPDAETMRLHQGAIHMGTALVVMGIVATVLAGWSHWRALRRLRRGEQPVLSQWPLSIAVTFLMALVGLVGVWAIFVR